MGYCRSGTICRWLLCESFLLRLDDFLIFFSIIFSVFISRSDVFILSSPRVLRSFDFIALDEFHGPMSWAAARVVCAQRTRVSNSDCRREISKRTRTYAHINIWQRQLSSMGSRGRGRASFCAGLIARILGMLARRRRLATQHPKRVEGAKR